MYLTRFVMLVKSGKKNQYYTAKNVMLSLPSAII